MGTPLPASSPVPSPIAPHQDPMTLFRTAIRSPVTRDHYERALLTFLARPRLKQTPQEFLRQAEKDPKWAEGEILAFILESRERVEKGELVASSLPNFTKPLKLFLEINDVVLNWKKLNRMLPQGREVAQDRAPTFEEVRGLAGDSDFRMRFAVLAMASGGFRLGGWEGMLLKHVNPVIQTENGRFIEADHWQVMALGEVARVVAAKVQIYPGTKDEYTTYISPEAYGVLQAYLRYRAENGESLGPNSALLRRLFQRGKAGVKPIPPLNALSVRNLLHDRLWRLQMRTEKKRRHDFQMMHGFRKFFKTRAEQAMKPLHVEMLLGHSVGLSDNYYRPKWEDVLEDYLKAVPFLTILSQQVSTTQVEDLKKLGERIRQLEDEKKRLDEASKPAAAVLTSLTPELERLIESRVNSLVKTLSRGGREKK